jgi:hypothetical protein
MWKYLKAAFWLKTPAPLVGPLPLNVVALSVCGIVGFAFPPMWFVGAAAEAVWLYWLSTDRRFRAITDGNESLQAQEQVKISREQIVESLHADRRARLRATEGKFAKVIERYRAAKGTSFVVSGNAEALAKLMSMYVNLLVADQSLEDAIKKTDAERLQSKAAALALEIENPGLTETAKASKKRTLEIVEERIRSNEGRKQQREEVKSDLERIEAQIDLALENASAPVAISSSIDLVSDMISADTLDSPAQGVDLYRAEIQ